MTKLLRFWHNLIDPTRERSAFEVIELEPESAHEFAQRVATAKLTTTLDRVDWTPRHQS